METAVAKELYERAAELRDAIQKLKKVEQVEKLSR
jgi:protein-arginine kinase activator protein McsA